MTTIINWPENQNYRDLQVFLVFANFYRQFINEIFSHCDCSNFSVKGGEEG